MKAFDSVNRQCLWKVLTEIGISSKLVEMLQPLTTRCKHVYNGTVTDWHSLTVPWERNRVPWKAHYYSPYSSLHLQNSSENMVNMEFGCRKVTERFTFLFTPTVLHWYLPLRWAYKPNASKNVGLTITADKTKTMVFRRGNWFLDQTLLEVVNFYHYLS